MPDSWSTATGVFISKETRWKLAVAALGVVYGDIGTSPLYALRECRGLRYLWCMIWTLRHLLLFTT